MANCTEYEGLIAAAVYDALEPAEARLLDQHLTGCDACRRDLEELRRVARRVGAGGAELGERDRQEILQGIERRVRPLSTASFRRGPAPSRQGWAGRAALAAGFLVAFAGIVLVARLTDPSSAKDMAIKPAPREEPRPPLPAPPAPPEPKPAVPKPPPPPEAPPRPVEGTIPPNKPAPPPPEAAPPAEKPAKPPQPPAPEKPPPAPEATPPRERPTVSVMARLERVQGDVAVDGAPAKAGLDLVPGQEVVVGGRLAYAGLKCTDGTRLDLYGDTAVRLVSDRRAPSGSDPGAGRSVLLLRGLVAAEVTRQPAGHPMVFATPNAEARVLGTTLKLEVRGDLTRLEVREGRVRLTRKEDGAFTDVTADHVAVATKGVPIASRPSRVHDGLVTLYAFAEGRGNVVRDVSGVGLPLDLKGKNMTWEAGGLALREKARVSSEEPAAKVVEACRRSNELTVEAWVRPARAALDFEGCIVGLSNDVTERNFALVQGDGPEPAVYSFSLRTSATDGGGRPRVLTPKGALEARLAHVAYVRHANGQERLYVNGVERAGKSRSGTFSTWDDTYRFHLGNEATEERPWQGEYRLVAVYARALVPAEVARNFKLGVD
jgi:hypothetical protein